MAELENVIHDLPICIDFAESRGYGGLVDVMRDALALLKAQEPGWISVKDRLPEGKTNPVTLDFNEVICFCDFGGDPKRTDVRTYKFGTMFGDTRPHFWHGPQIMDGVVTHWQYLPEPPKEG